jgi:hypothetical protein
MMSSQMGRAIVSNSSMQILLKQSSSAVDVLASVFKLTSEEQKRLSQFPVGQGLLFAGSNHVHINVIASPTETSLISTNPEEIKKVQEVAQRAQEAYQIMTQQPNPTAASSNQPNQQ